MERALDTESTGAPGSSANLRALKDSVKLFWVVADRYAKRRLLWVMVLACVAAVTAALTPVSLKLAIDSFDGANGDGRYGPVVLITLYVLGQYVTRCLNELHFFAHGQAQGRLERNLGFRLFDHLLHLPMRFHLERRTGAMGQIAEQGINACEQLLHQTIFTLLQVTLQFASVAIVLLHFGYPVYFAILAAAAVGYVVVYERGARDIQEPAHAMSAARIDAQAAMTDNLLNAEAIKCYDAERVVSRRYDGDLARVESAWRSFARQRLITGIGVGTVFALSVGGSLIYAAYGVTQKTMTVGDFVLVNSYILQFVTPLELLGFALREIVRALANLHGLFGVLSQKTEGDAAIAYDRSPGDCCGELTFRNVTFSYGPDRVVLRNVSFHVPAGRALAVVGVSGSGKSSLVRLLFRLYEPNCGEIVLDGVPISQLPLSTVRQAIAVVPQDTVLFNDTIAANIAFGRYGAAQAEIEKAARIANLHDFICRQPAGYETVVGERGLKLSGGERQRVAIARAALKRPRVFVFDEATSSLDSKTERDILRNLNEVSSHSTTLVIAHRLSTVVHADEIVVLHEGKVIERGAHAHLLALNGQYAALWRAQQGAVLLPERQERST